MAKQSRHIMFTQKQLVEFGNYLLTTYGVQVHSTDGKNQPLFQREVTDADFSNWEHIEEPNPFQLPSGHQMEDRIWVCLWSTRFGGQIDGVHFYHGKVKYDVKVFGENGDYTKMYNVDSAFISKTVDLQ